LGHHGIGYEGPIAMREQFRRLFETILARPKPARETRSNARSVKTVSACR
jgi:hypothetical protein